MSNYRRLYVPGGTYFFTVVTHDRSPILDCESSRRVLHRAINEIRANHPFVIQAIVLLPEHLHTIWTLPPTDSDFSTRWGLIKARFTRLYLAAGGAEGQKTANHIAHRERAVWQHRFWEHSIDDEDDFKRCFDYIHWNPVKHGHVNRVRDYPWSSFHRWANQGEYSNDWGEIAAGDVPGAEWE